MRVLIAAKYVTGCSHSIGGVQSWSDTVASELRRLGHDVTLWCPEFELPEAEYDAGIMSNIAHTRPAVSRCRSVVAVSHGIIEAERPTELPTVFTSEGVREHWKADGPIVRQPIDLEFWRPAGYERYGIMRYSYRGGLKWLDDVAKSLGQSYAHYSNESHDVVRNEMRLSSLVLATGRAALEAAACGTPVVICDHRSAYQGPLCAPFGLRQAWNNYSGRGGFVPTPELVADLCRRAMDADGWREYVERHHDAREIVQQILSHIRGS